MYHYFSYHYLYVAIMLIQPSGVTRVLSARGRSNKVRPPPWGEAGRGLKVKCFYSGITNA